MSPDREPAPPAQATEATGRTLSQRVADALGVTGQAITEAVNGLNALHMPLTPAHLEARLGVPTGSIDSALAGMLGPAVPSCTCPLIVGQSIAQTCPYCQHTAQEAGAKEQRHLETQRQQRQHRKFQRQLLRSVNAR